MTQKYEMMPHLIMSEINSANLHSRHVSTFLRKEKKKAGDKA